MSSFMIVTDSSVDLSQKYMSENDVKFVSLTVNLDGREFQDDYGVTVGLKDFYSALRGGKMASTAQVNTYTFLECFKPMLEEGKDILYLGLSSGLSGTYQQSVVAMDELREQYPGRKMYSIDTCSVTLGLGLLVAKAVKLRREGKSIDEVRDVMNETAPRCNHLFTVEDLMFLHRGGRVSKATAVVGGLLSIKPLLLVSPEGKLVAKDKIRGRKQSLQRLADWMGDFVEGTEFENVFIVHGDCEEDARFLADILSKRYKIKNLWVELLGCTIGAHAGPGTVALFFEGKPRVNY